MSGTGTDDADMNGAYDTHAHDGEEDRIHEPPLESRVADFWGDVIPIPIAPDIPLVPDPAIASLVVPELAIRGRNPADLLRPAYDSLTSR